MSDQRLKIAVFIDFDNVEIGVKNTLNLQFDIGAVLEAIKERGEIITKVAYGDWKRAGDYGRALSQHAVRLVQRVMTPGGDKNGADINLALDALEMAFTHDHINAFVIVGGDSDFITLVEKLKQYDKKVFVVGGRSFTSQVMQKNCTEFLAYENVAGAARQSTPRSDRGKGSNAGGLEQSLPLVKRALKVLSDREVTPQLGLLKSTLLQLDSSFSERDYGSSTFRDFAEKLEQRGWITLKHSGRTTLVELAGTDGEPAAPQPAAPQPAAPPLPVDQRDRRSPHPVNEDDAEEVANAGSTLPEGVALFRAVLQEAQTPPRWPMYMRQVKQFIRSVRPDFDERRYGSLSDLMRAAQKEGVIRLERDRQGGLRVFSASTTGRSTPVPHGWNTLNTPTTAEADVETPETQSDFGIVAPPPVVETAPAVSEEQPAVDAPVEKKRSRRPRATRVADASTDAPAATPTRARKTRAAAKTPRVAKRSRG